MPEPALRLVQTDDGHLVDSTTGEHLGECPNCAAVQDQLDGAHKEIRAWRARYADLKRDKEREMKDHELFPVAAKVFEYWKERCCHPRSDFTPDRFFLLMPFVKRYGEKLCRQAIDGAAFDPFVTRRKNGSPKRHDGVDLIFRSADKFEEFCNRAPKEDR